MAYTFERKTDDFGAADLILLNGTVHSLSGSAASHEGVAVRDGTILTLGSNMQMAGLVGDKTTVVDLAGRTAVPGFIETHNHPIFYGMTLAAPVEAGSPPNDRIGDIVDRVAAAVRDHEPGAWVRGYRYDDTLLADDRHPTRADLDPASPDHPVCLLHISGHFCVLNSAGLRAVGIDRDTPDPVGGAIIRDEKGEPTGVLAETAAFSAYAAMPTAAVEDYVDALERAGDSYLANGVTTVHDTGVGLLGGPAELTAYRRAMGSGRFRNRIQGYLVADLFDDLGGGRLSDVEASVAGLGDDMFRLAGVKMWADGSIQGLTGCVSEGYACAPDNYGILIHPPEDLARRIAALDDAGWQVAVHGNGDQAIQTILDAYAALGARPNERDSRHRIEHCQMASEGQLDVMASAGIHASFFIKHVYYWGDRHRDRFLGQKRAERLDPLLSAGRHGVRFGLHSDTPVVPVSPLEGMWCAVNRVTRDGQELGSDQAVPTATALRAYTAEAAHLAHEENRKGRLEPGMLADIAVLSSDPLHIDPARLRDVSAHATIVGGEVAWLDAAGPDIHTSTEGNR